MYLKRMKNLINQKQTTRQIKCLLVLNSDPNCIGKGFLTIQLKLFFNKIVYKFTLTGSILFNSNNKLKQKHTLVFFIGFTDWFGGTKPTSMKGSKNNK